MDMDEDDKLDCSVVLLSEIKSEKRPRMCLKPDCEKRLVFPLNDLIVRCLLCHGCYHPACAGALNNKLGDWLNLMKDVQIREEWKFICEFCKKDLCLFSRLNSRMDSFSSDLKEFDERTSINNGKFVSRFENVEVKLLQIEKTISVLKDVIPQIEKISDTQNQEKEIISKELDELKMNNAFYTKNIAENNDIAKKIEMKVDQINFVSTKINEEINDESNLPWNTVVKKNKKKLKSFPVVMQLSEDKTMEELKGKMTEKFDPREVHVAKTFVTKNNTLVAVCTDEEAQQKFAEIAKKDYSELCEVQTPEKKIRRIKALNIEIWTNFNDLTNELIQQNIRNANVFLNEAKVVNFMKAYRNGKESESRIHVVFEVDETTFEQAINYGKIKYLYQEVRIVDGFTVGKCFKCLSFDHVATKCPTPDVKVCFKCGENHLLKDCNANDYKCINCMRANLEIKSANKLDINHSVNSIECKCYQRKYNFLFSHTKIR